MEHFGHIQNGVVVLDGNPHLPEGAAVTVSITSSANPTTVTEMVCEPGKLPYIRGGIPGTWNLTNEMIERIFEEEDIESLKRQQNAPS